MHNLIPNTPIIASFELIGNNKARVVHSSLVDYDAEYVVCYVYMVNTGVVDYTTATDKEIYLVPKDEINFFEMPVPASTGSTKDYVIELAVLDALGAANNSAGGIIKTINRVGSITGTISNPFIVDKTPTVINVSQPSRLVQTRGGYITNISQAKPDSFSNLAPAFLLLTLGSQEGTRVSSIEIWAGSGYSGASDLSGISWDSVYSGNFVNSLSIGTGLTKGTEYVFRVQSTFPDGTVSSYEYYDQNIEDPANNFPLISIIYDESTAAPPGFVENSISFEAYTSWDGTPTYDLLMKWQWSGSEENYARHFEIQYIKNNSITDATMLSGLLDWNSSNIRTFSAGSSTSQIVLPAFAYADRYAFRIRAVGWGDADDKYSDWEYGKVSIGPDDTIAFDIVPLQGLPPTGNNLQVTKDYIRAYKNWDGSVGTVTFQIDAGTGNIAIGESSEFFYDAVNTRLSIDGTTIVNEINAASFVMDWLDGTPPVFRSANKTGFGNSKGSGIWAGFTDENVFKLDIGSDASNIRWDGTDLTISGGVTINVPDPTQAAPGTIGYTTLSLVATTNAVIFTDGTTVQPVVIDFNAASNGNSDFIDKLEWVVEEITDPGVIVDKTSLLTVDSSNRLKASLPVDANNNLLLSSNRLRVYCYYKKTAETTHTNAEIVDYTTIGKVNSIENVDATAVYGYLTNEVHPIPLGTDGKPPATIVGANGTFQVFDDILNVQANTTFSVVDTDGTNASINASTGAYSLTSIPLDIDGFSDEDTYNIKLKAVYDKDGTNIEVFQDFKVYVVNPGPTGAEGTKTAQITLFKRSTSSSPTGPAGTITYNFSDKTVSGVTNGWSLDIPTGVNPLFASVGLAVASSGNVSDTITFGDVGQSSGVAGVSTYSTVVYRSASSEPTKPANSDFSYNFGTNTLTKVSGSWQIDIPTPANGEEVWASAGSFDSASPTGTDTSTTWGNPGRLSKTGSTGASGKSSIQLTLYRRASSRPTGAALPSTTKFDFTNNEVVDLDTNWYTSIPAWSEGANPVWATTGIAVIDGDTGTSDAIDNWSTAQKLAEDGRDGQNGSTGARAPVFVSGDTSNYSNADPTNESTWSGGVASIAYQVLDDLVDSPKAFDTLTLYKGNDGSKVDSRIWNGTTWETAAKIHGNLIVDGTMSAKAIRGDSGFFQDIAVNQIYNHGANGSNYKMLIDFASGFIHIRG